MGTARYFAIPGALFGSLILALFGFMVTAGIAAPGSLPSGASLNATLQAVSAVESAPTEPVALEAAAPAEESDPEEQGGDCAVSSRFPASITQWCEWITRFARRNNLEPNFVAAVMLQESGGDPLAYSHSGAVGLMQVMPRDGLAANFMCKAGPCFTNRPSIAELQDPKFNIRYGAEMLGNLFSRHGSLRDALLYYGPMDVGYYYADKVLAIYENYRD